MPGKDVDDHWHRREAFKNAEQETRSDSAGKGTHAAHNNHDERQHEEIEAHVVVWCNDRCIHNTRQTSHRSGKTEHKGKALVDVDAQQANRFTVCHASANNHSEGGELQEGKHPANDHG